MIFPYYTRFPKPVDKGERHRLWVNTDNIYLTGNLAVKAPVLNYTPTLLDSVTLQCSITHGLVTEITWFKNNKVLLIANDSGLSGGNERVPSLTIISVTKTDMGYYICQASNVNATVSTFIIVLSPKGWYIKKKLYIHY